MIADNAPQGVQVVTELILACHQGDPDCVFCHQPIVGGWYLVSVCTRQGRRFGCFPVHLNCARPGTIANLHGYFYTAADIPGAVAVPVDQRPAWWW